MDDALQAEERDRFRGTWQTVIEANAPFEQELRLRRGLRRNLSMAPRPNRSHDGQTERSEVAWDRNGYRGSKTSGKCPPAETEVGEHWAPGGGIAHDFNNLLTGVLGGASYAAEYLPAAHPLQSTLQMIVKSAERAAKLTRQMLDYSGKGSVFIEQLDLSGIVRETCELIQASIPPHVELSLETAARLPAIEADASQIQQVVMNLVINAAEAISGDQPGRVVVRTFCRTLNDDSLPSDCVGPNELTAGNYVLLEVEDSGSGMDAATKAHIFDPFFTTKFTGRGLGLAAVQGILRSARGCVAVESSPGKGSIFRAFIPACNLDATPKPKQEVLETTRLRPRERVVLVVDDETVVRELARIALERGGYEVITAADGRAGIEILMQQRERISLVLLDMRMPVMGGKEFLLRARDSGIDVPTVICSGYSEQEVRHQFENCAVAAFLQKPFNMARLYATVQEVLKGVLSQGT